MASVRPIFMFEKPYTGYAGLRSEAIERLGAIAAREENR
jgi:hypothetical protein